MYKMLRMRILQLELFYRQSRKIGSDFPDVKEILSEESRTSCINKIKSARVAQRESNEENKKRASVLIPLCLVNDELALLYTLRTTDLKRHRGQVSFPGGMEDAKDNTLEDTALRETEEEIGVNRNCIQVWGSGNLYVGKEFTVLPVVGYLGQLDPESLNINPDEVEVAFTITLKHFCQLENCKYTHFRYRGSNFILPAYISSKFRVWGITALITHIVLKSLLPDHYKHELHFIKPIKIS